MLQTTNGRCKRLRRFLLVALALATAVAGDAKAQSAVASVTISSSPLTGTTYELGETIEVTVGFNGAVYVTTQFQPGVTLGIGSATRTAKYASGSQTTSLVFRYTVQASDTDTDGISIAATALTGNIYRSGALITNQGLGSNAITNSSGHKVNGMAVTAPVVSGTAIASSPASGDTYVLGEQIDVTVTFNRLVAVTGTPQLALTIGTATRQANYASRTGTALTFSYTVQGSDRDADGISVAASALTLNSGTINDPRSGGGAATLGLGTNAISTSSDHKVNGTAASVMNFYPTRGGVSLGRTHKLGEQIEFTAIFTHAVTVTGTPQVALGIGSVTRQANYASGSGTTTLLFRYTVVAGDSDSDGITVARTALTLNGGSITDARDGTTAASLGLPIPGGKVDVFVDGSQGPAGVSDVSFSSLPASGDTYGLAERIEVRVTFNKAVAVTGAPQLALTIGTATRQASYASGPGTTSLTFGYRVQTGDEDTDGISVGPSALTLNGGTIKNAGEDVSAVLALGSHAISNDGLHKVDGAVETAPMVSGVLVTSSPGASGAYGLGSVIVVEVTFDRLVEVTGEPRLALTIGGGRRRAAYASGSGTAVLVFRYVVLGADVDPDGFGVPEDALELNGGEIVIAGGSGSTPADLGLGSHAMSDIDGQEVNGGGGTDPYFGMSTYPFELREDVAGPVVVGTVGATDPFGGGLTYVLGDGSEGLFELDASSGELTYVGTGEDAERRSEYLMELRAEAGDGRVGTALASVKVLNVNEAPVFVKEEFPVELEENTVGPVVLEVAEAVDLDEGDTLTYRMEAGDGERFEVDGETGEVRYVGGGEDYEGSGPKSWELEVSATDLAGSSARATVVVALTNVNEAPVFVKEEFPVELKENAAGPVSLGMAEAVDEDEDDALTYRLEAGDGERFEVDGETGEVRYVGGGEDYEGSGPGSWKLEVSATDLAGSSARATVAVALTNMNDAPVFVKEEFPFELKENAVGPVVLEVAEAVDEDEDDALTYRLEAGDGERFEVDGETGEVRYVGGGEDYEGSGPKSWELEVSATDLAGSSARATVAVALTNVNDAPVFVKEEFPFELKENAVGPVVLEVAEAVDEDEDDALTYRLEAGDGERFEVDGASGEVRYVGAGEDYEGGGPRSWELEVSATDLAGSSARATVAVALTNVNDAPVFVKEEFPFELAENAVGPVVLEVAEAVDEDEDDALTYRLEAGDGERFEVDGETGEVRYVGGGEDYEGSGPGSWELEVSATDLAGSSARATVVVALTNMNDAPVFVKEEFPLELKENAAGPVALGPVGATDEDEDDALTYRLEAGDGERFEVDGETGEVRYVGAGEDYEGGGPKSWELEVSATDLAGSSARATVVVALTNMNDAPVFVKEEFPFELKENAVGPVVLEVVEAVDLDEGDALTYRLEAGDGERFEVDGETGEVRYVGGGEDYEGGGPKSWELEVSATDLAGSSVRATVAVALTNVNEAPAFADSAYAFELAENAVGPVALGPVGATDEDAGDVLTYSLAGEDAARFEVDGASGEVRYVGAGEDAETGPAGWELEVVVADRGGLTDRAPVAVALVDVNEAPAFADSAYAFDLAENAAGPVALGPVGATDEDAGDVLTYSLTGEDAARFEVDGASGEVRYVGAGEDAETGPAGWELEVVVADRDGLTDRAPVTVALVDVNEAPAFADSAYAFDLAENAAGPVALGRVGATDEDAGDMLTYSLAGGDAARFEVDGASGEVRYVGAGEDAETGSAGWELEVVVADRGGLTDRAPVTVALLDVNEAPAFADSAYAFDLAENAAGPVALGQVGATDEDAGDVLTYSLTGEDAARFEVDGASGEVRYVGAGEDAETGPAGWELEVVVADRDGLTDRAPVTVALVDVNEAPAFADSAYAFELAENAAGPVALGRVGATDEDAGDMLTYSLAGEDAVRFEVDGASGEVRYVGAGEDAETGPAGWELEVVVADRDGLTDRAPVTVALVDVNEAPAFADSAYAFELAENAAGPVALGRVGATDEDAGDVLTYSLASGDAARFEVDGTSGEVRYVGGGENYEDGPPRYALVVRVVDADGLADEAGVVVTVLDVNEGPEAVGGIAPKVLEAYGAAVEEEMGPYFRDPDGDALSYAAESSAPGVVLAAVTESGRLSIAPQAIGVATVTVRATDPGGLEAMQQVQVTVEASRSERARALKLTLAAFGRSLGAETVDAIGGRLGVESSSALGRSHVRLGGRSVGCGEFGGGGEKCGLATLARGASGLLGARLSHPGGALVGTAGGPGATIDAAALLFGGGGEQGGFGFGGGGTYQGQQESAAKVGPGGLEFDPVSRRNLLSQSSFQLSFGGGEASTGGDSLAAAPQAAASRAGWTLWGQASAGEFEGVPDDGFALEGRTRSAYAGLDYRFGSGLLLGLAGSRSGMESDFESGINGAGSVDARLTSLYPYLHWSPREGLGLWGAAGAGRGSADLEELAGGRFSTDLDMRMGALGARQELVGALALKADAFSVRIQSADATEMAGVTANAQRVRLAPELSGQWAVGGASVRTRLELGGRLDRGDAETGLGAEAGAELGFTHRASGFSVDARGRTLLVHQAEDFKEWNASVALRLQPGRDQGGLSFSLEPSWGAGGGAQTLWQTQGRLGPQAMAQHAAAPGWTPDRLAMELGWGAVLPGGGQVRPFGRWSREGADGYRLNVGTQWSVLGQPGEGQGQGAQGLRLMIDLFGEQAKNTSLQPSERRMGLLGRIEFR